MPSKVRSKETIRLYGTIERANDLDQIISALKIYSVESAAAKARQSEQNSYNGKERQTPNIMAALRSI